MLKKLCVSLTIVMMCCLMVVPAFAKDTIIHNMLIQVDVDKQGNAAIKETWTMDVNEGTEVYKVLDNMEESRVSHLKVTDDKGQIYQSVDEWDVDWDFDEKINKCGIVEDGDRYELCFGIGEYGYRTYTFEYRVSNFIKQYDECQGFNYAFFSDMSLDIEHAKAIVSSPFDFDEENSQIWAFGYAGRVYYSDGQVILESDDALYGDMRMQMLMRINDQPFSHVMLQQGSFQKVLDKAIDGSVYDSDTYQQDGYYSAFPYKDDTWIILSVFGVGAVLAIIVISLVVSYDKVSKRLKAYRFEDDQLFDKNNVPLYQDIPCQGDVFLIYYLAKKGDIEENKSGLMSALLMQWAKEGYIDFEKQGKKKFSIDLKKYIPMNNEVEREFLEFLMDAAGKDQVLTSKEFEKWCEKHWDDLEKWFDKVIQYVDHDLRLQDLIHHEEAKGKWFGRTVVRQRDVLSVTLRDMMEQIAGLKDYLESKQFIHENVEILDKYMVYAGLLGVYNDVEKGIKKAYPSYQDNPQFYMFYAAGHIHHFTNDSYQASYNAHQSSSISGGGSSFSGGGGGGVR